MVQPCTSSLAASPWVGDQLHELSEAEPVEDRAANTWEPLIAIADAAGDYWPVTAGPLSSTRSPATRNRPTCRSRCGCSSTAAPDSVTPTASPPLPCSIGSKPT